MTSNDMWAGWSIARDSYEVLEERLSARSPSVIVESGSGASSVLFAEYAHKSGATYVALEHLPLWHAHTLLILAERQLPVSHIRLAPLHQTEYGIWYSTVCPEGIDFALIDGPPIGEGGRLAALPMLWDHLAEDFELWLDDARREHERMIVHSWGQQFPIEAEFFNVGHGMFKITPAKQ